MTKNDAPSDAAKTPPPAKPSPGNLRAFGLMGLLLAMMVALWYDYKVARPQVEMAFETITALNDRINASGGARTMTNADVQKALQKQPSRVYSEGGYRIEVYSWRAGLPILTRDYYALFLDSGPYPLLKHFRFQLPEEELIGTASAKTVYTTNPTNQLPPQPTGIGGGGGTGKRRGDRSQSRPADETSPPATSQSEATPEANSETPKSDSKPD